MQQLFLELLNIAIGNSDCLSRIPSESEWSQLFAISKQQAVLGFCYTALSKLPKEQFPPQSIYLQWLAFYNIISKRNQLLNDRCAQLQQKLQDDGFKHIAFLKGQTNAVRYPDPFCRQCGDIDVWVEGGKDFVVDYVTKKYPTDRAFGEHVDYNLFSDVIIELHFRVGFEVPKPIKKKVFPYFQSVQEKDFPALTLPNGKNITVLDRETNLIHQIVHVVHHVNCGGIGLRQFIDYYFLLKDAKKNDVDFKKVHQIIKQINLLNYASAVMYVLVTLFHLPDDLLICKPNAWRGKFLIREIFNGGNFGHYNNFSKVNRKRNFFVRKICGFLYQSRFLPYFPYTTLRYYYQLIKRIINKIIKFK